MAWALGDRGRGRSVRGALLAGGFAVAAFCAPDTPAASGPNVRARLVVPARLAAGATGAVLVEMTLGRGWHVNSHTPRLRFLVPTTLTLTATAGTLSEVRYPKAVLRRFEFTEAPLEVYEGTVRFEAVLTVPGAAAGTVEVDAVLAFQACDDHQCFQPATAALHGTVAVAEAGSNAR